MLSSVVTVSDLVLFVLVLQPVSLTASSYSKHKAKRTDPLVRTEPQKDAPAAGRVSWTGTPTCRNTTNAGCLFLILDLCSARISMVVLLTQLPGSAANQQVLFYFPQMALVVLLL